jgi:peroxiredoxin
MDANNEIKLRLRFYKDVEENIETVRKKFEVFKINCTQDCPLKTKNNHIWMNMPDSKRKYWSPHLHLELEPKDNNETHIRGLFGPEPNLWTLFMFLHFIVAGIFIIFSVMAYSNHFMKRPYTMDLIVMMLMVIVWFLLYFIARQIRYKGYEQMNELKKNVFGDFGFLTYFIMKTSRVVLIIYSILVLSSCYKNPDYGNPEVDVNIIQKEYMNWWTYYSKNIVLSSDYIALDVNMQIISKDHFLKLLTTGDFIPIRLKSKSSITHYKLYNLMANCDDIKSTIMSESIYSYENFKKEGTSIPEFNFMDLNGNIYNKKTTKGKIIVLKCWFIHCQKCVQEMPELNKMVKQYKNRKDIIFVSLATDTNQELKKFLTKKIFNYAVVPNQTTYITEILNINEYPTHLIINKKGGISKIVSNFKELSIALKKESLMK